MRMRQLDNSENRFKIMRTACELFRSKGFENTSVADLLKKLQIEEQVFFAHFKSMDELLEVVWSES